MDCTAEDKKQEAKVGLYRSPEHQPIRGQGGHLGFPIGTKNTNLIEGVEDLLPIKFRKNPFNGCGKEAEKYCQSEARAAIFDFRSARKYKLNRGRWGLASCQVSSKSIQRLRRRSRKMFQPIRGQGGHLRFPIGTKNTNLIEGVNDLLLVKFSQNPFSGCGKEVENVSANQRPGRPSWMTKLDRKQELNVLYQAFLFVPIRHPRWLPWPLSGWNIFRLLLHNHWTDSDETWQKARTQRPLPSFSFCADPSSKMAALASDWLKHFSTSSPQPLNGFWQNLIGSKYSKPSIKFVFFVPIGNYPV